MMKLKALLALVLALVLGLSLVACAPAEEAPAEKVTVRVAALSGSTGLGMAKLMTDAKNGATANTYTFEVFDAPEQLVPELSATDKKYDIAALPTNVAARLYNVMGQDLQILAVNTLGVLSALEIGTDTVKSVADLKGKTIYTTGQGATPEYALRYILEQNGLNPDEDVEIFFETTADGVVSHAQEGAILILPEPKVTAVSGQTEGAKVVLDLTAEWDKVCDTPMAQGCVVVSKAFAAAHPDEVAAFLTEYEASINFVKNNAAEASVMVAEHGIIPKAPLAQKAIPKSNLTFKAGADMKTILEPFYQILFDSNPASIGGKMPADEFYYGA